MKAKEDFNKLVDTICQMQSLGSMRQVVEKELLHYDILFILAKEGFLKKLTFQGGTALRLCYNLKRFSEDLDFVGGKAFSVDDFQALKSTVESYITQRYGLDVVVKEPRASNEDSSHAVKVMKWQLAIITRPENRSFPKQRVKLEVANVPAHTRKLMPILSNYPFLPDGYSDTFIHVESLEEILADKVIALAARNHLKARDIWDIQWLLRKTIKLNIVFIKQKIADYSIHHFPELLKKRAKETNVFIYSESFSGEMSRFLDNETVERTLEREGFLDYICEQIRELIADVIEKMKLT